MTISKNDIILANREEATASMSLKEIESHFRMAASNKWDKPKINEEDMLRYGDPSMGKDNTNADT